MVTLIREGYFTKHIQPLLKKSSSKMAEAHSLFRLSAANNEIMPVSNILRPTYPSWASEFHGWDFW